MLKNAIFALLGDEGKRSGPEHLEDTFQWLQVFPSPDSGNSQLLLCRHQR
jgi:hypothetical protein